jgi:hypothetical protein
MSAMTSASMIGGRPARSVRSVSACDTGRVRVSRASVEAGVAALGLRVIPGHLALRSTYSVRFGPPGHALDPQSAIH